MKTLLLWDIDGTLTLSGGAGMRALGAALRNEFGIDRSLGPNGRRAWLIRACACI